MSEEIIVLNHLRYLAYAGCYRIGNEGTGTCFYLKEKPCWFHRKMMKLCLGWEWRDNK